MKPLITIILTALLAACGSGNIETTVKSDEAIAQPAIIVVEPPVIEAPAVTPPEPIVTTPTTPATPEPACSPTTYIPCGGAPVTDVIPVNETCNFETLIPCRAYPPICTGNKTLVQGICTAP